MNVNEYNVLKSLFENDYFTQRQLAHSLGISLGTVNKSLKQLIELGYLNSDLKLTDKAYTEIKYKSPKNAIILAAGLGLRMIPINNSLSKGLLEVDGECLIERVIKQLREVGISKIYIVVGFMKEQYEFLIDKYQVELIVNKDYALNNSIYSLSLAAKYLSNSYIIPCDIYCKENPFRRNELYSWYMISDELTVKSHVRLNRKNQLVFTNQNTSGNRMVGISYLVDSDAKILRNNLDGLLKSEYNHKLFWEDSLIKKDRFLIPARLVSHSDYFEIDTYEQLRALDDESNQLHSESIELLTSIFQVEPQEIKDISALKKGMTNRSFIFRIRDKRYIMRIPGEGTDKLINRKEESSVYEVIKNKGICDDIIYLNANNGYKVTEFINGARTCNTLDNDDVKKCMIFLRAFHDQKFEVGHVFNIYKQLEFYESLWGGANKSVYQDYIKTKQQIYELKEFIEHNKRTYCLTHIDAVPDNFLFVNENGIEKIRLIDWEYSGMQDPDVDLAMFSIYSLYNKEQIDNLIRSYYIEGCTKCTQIKIYCYIATCGLLWSNWCEYKRLMGIEFGEYALRQYRYAKDYYKIAKEEMGDV